MPYNSSTARTSAHLSWAHTRDRRERTAPARDAANRRWHDQARELLGPDATEQQVTDSATSLRKAYFGNLARKSAEARKRAA